MLKFKIVEIALNHLLFYISYDENLILKKKKKTNLLLVLIPKEPWVFKDHNLNFDRICKLEKWSNGA